MGLCFLVLGVTDILFFVWVKEKVIDGSDQVIEATSNITQNRVRPSFRSVTFWFQRRVVDDKATDPTKAKS